MVSRGNSFVYSLFVSDTKPCELFGNLRGQLGMYSLLKSMLLSYPNFDEFVSFNKDEVQ